LRDLIVPFLILLRPNYYGTNYKLLSIMKKTFFIWVFLIFASSIFAQDRKAPLARVDHVSGIPLFVYSLPVNEYEVVGKAVTSGQVIKLTIDEVSGLRDKADRLVKKALERVKKGKIPAFDGIIIDLDKEKALAIKFKGEKSDLAKVLTFEGVPVYLFATPEKPYKTIKTLEKNYSLYAQRGLLYDKIKSMVKRTLDLETEGTIGKFDAILVNADDLSEKVVVFE